MKTDYKKLNQLTNREVEVITLMAKGKSNREITEKLHITRTTLLTHMKAIYTKLGVNPVQKWDKSAIRVRAVLKWLEITKGLKIED